MDQKASNNSSLSPEETLNIEEEPGVTQIILEQLQEIATTTVLTRKRTRNGESLSSLEHVTLDLGLPLHHLHCSLLGGVMELMAFICLQSQAAVITKLKQRKICCFVVTLLPHIQCMLGFLFGVLHARELGASFHATNLNLPCPSFMDSCVDWIYHINSSEISECKWGGSHVSFLSLMGPTDDIIIGNKSINHVCIQTR